MTTKQLRDLARSLAQFSFEYHGYKPPHEITATIEMIDITADDQEAEEDAEEERASLSA